MDFFSFGDNRQVLLSLDPRTKLLLFVMGGFIALQSAQIGPLCVYLTVLCVILALCGKRAFAAKAFVVFAVATYAQMIIIRAPVNAEAFPIATIFGGLCMLVLFTFPIVLSFVLVISTTRISQFLAAFERMHLPNSVVIPLAVFFRFIPTVQEEWTSITKAMAFRGIAMTPATVLAHPLKAVEQVLVPLLFSSIAVMDELSAAALARGLDSAKGRSSYETIKLRWPDYLVMAFVVVMVVYVFVMG